MTEQQKPVANRAVVGNISLSLDGRTTGPGGEYDMSWIVPHASCVRASAVLPHWAE